LQLWQEAGPQPVNVEGLHAHVVRLQERFLERLDAAGHPAISTRTLLPPQDTACRSHTLVFAQPDAPAAKDVVDGLASKGVAVDCRKAFVRFGFGANHSAADVDALLEALIALAPSARKV
jgi:selenocysteine lyase/cysteine desulfurase